VRHYTYYRTPVATVDVHRLLNIQSETRLSMPNTAVAQKALVIRGNNLMEGKITLNRSVIVSTLYRKLARNIAQVIFSGKHILHIRNGIGNEK
jgi:hypothetical protein